jgi:hypothetical protein
MNAIERRLRAAVNPVSTAITGWWCQSAVRHLLTGHGPSARQQRLIRIRRQAARAATRAAAQGADRTAAQAAARAAARAAAQGADPTAAPSAETMRARAAAINELLASHDHQT